MNSFVVRLSNRASAKYKRPHDASGQSFSSVVKISRKKESTSNCVQAYLDLGQKSMGKTTRCKHCDMVFVVDDVDDVDNHRVFCREV